MYAYYQAETPKPYGEVLDELKSAIAENNFRITAHSRVGKVIRERGDKAFQGFDTIQFCNPSHVCSRGIGAALDQGLRLADQFALDQIDV